MNYKEAIEAGYEALTMPTNEKYLSDIQIQVMDRLLKGYQVVLVTSRYHDELSYIIMIKR